MTSKPPLLWSPDVKNWLIGKDPDAGKDWGQEEKGMTEDEMVGWHHWLDGHEFEQAPGVGDGQGGLACCSPWGSKESDTTEQLNWLSWVSLWKICSCSFGYEFKCPFIFIIYDSLQGLKCSVMYMILHVCIWLLSNFLWPHGLKPARLLCPWNFPCKNTAASCHSLLQDEYD